MGVVAELGVQTDTTAEVVVYNSSNCISLPVEERLLFFPVGAVPVQTVGT